MRLSRLWPLLATFLLLAFAGGTQAQNEPTQQPTPVTPAPAAAAQPACVTTVDQYNRAVRHVLRFSDRGGNYWASGISHKQLVKLEQMRRCAQSAQDHHKMVRYWQTRRHEWRFYRYIDSITPYGEWAIPTYIVMCESGGVYTKWNIGGSGASGAYQIMARTWASYGGRQWASAAAYAPPYAQHIVASRIWHGGGASQWSCS